MKKYLIINVIIVYLATLNAANAQNHIISGSVKGVGVDNKLFPLIGANVYWANIMAGTVTDNNGKFKLARNINTNLLVISYIGYKADTMEIKPEQKDVNVILLSTVALDEITITEKRGTAYYSKTNPINMQIVTQNELKKAACCNLSESFETNASVDVSFSDALTGAKQIELLGLAGIYTQMQMENIPSQRGLASIFGLSYVPGPWLESIQISKGTASVKNGFESITGQINYEYRKPDTSEKFYLNIFGNSQGRFEANSYSALKFSPRLSTMVFLHGNYFNNVLDKNNDGFFDIPQSEQFIAMNRWKLTLPNFEGQAGFYFTEDSKNGGQLKYNESTDKGTKNAYGFAISTSRLEGFYKGGFISKNKENTSTALILSASQHLQKSYFGLNNYNAGQKSFYANLLHQTIIGNTHHGLVTGASFIYDNYNLLFNDSDMSHKDIVPGAFAEYTYNSLNKLVFILGVRDDYHQKYGNIFTPRAHIRYKFNDNITLRASAGKGYRFPNVITENTMLLVTSKHIVFEDQPEMEEAWNYGVFLSYSKTKNEIPYHLNVDFYRTDFINQVIIDMDLCTDLVHIYNLAGKSYANSMQAEFNFEPLPRFKVMLAYRINDVKTTYFGVIKEKVMVKKSKGVINLAYATPWDKWKFDITFQYNGKSRLPQIINPDQSITQEYSPSFINLNAQISKNFKHFETYIGVENITGYIQKNLILDYENPFSSQFDASRVWGPVLGRRVYSGIRLTLN